MTVEINRKDGVTEYMSVGEFTRWMCLMEAFHYIEQKAEELKVDINKMMKPLAIDAYIEERYLSMKHDVECELSRTIEFL